MNWLHFLSGLAGVYFLYYLTVILFDLAKRKRNSAINLSGHELTFSENIVPEKLAADPDTIAESNTKTRLDEPTPIQKNEPEMIGSGGVVIDNLFKLCKQEAVIFTRAVSF